MQRTRSLPEIPQSDDNLRASGEEWPQKNAKSTKDLMRYSCSLFRVPCVLSWLLNAAHEES